MLIRLTGLRGWKVLASDGDAGTVKDVFFDDERWGARYVVVETGGWLSSRRVLISPASLRRQPGDMGTLHVDLTRAQIEASPDVDWDKPVSRRYEIAHARHYGYPFWWSGSMLWGAGIYPGVVPVPESAREPAENELAAREEQDAAERSHLRSAQEVIGYHVAGTDGDVGTLDDLAIDDETWAIRYLVVDAKPWWPGGLVGIDPAVAKGLSWQERRLSLDLTRDQIRDAQPSVRW